MSRPAAASDQATALEALIRRAHKALVLGIGGGGDVVGAYASALLCRELGTAAMLGGVTWERLPIDPQPGPRSADEIVDGRELAQGVLLAGPPTRTREGAVFAEARMADFLGEPTVLVDVGIGPAPVADGLEAAADALEVDLFVFVDVGGDVLGEGSEPGLASPLCDAVMLAAASILERRGKNVVAAVVGPCCDGELTVEELLGRLARVAATGALVGWQPLLPSVADELERAAAQIPTEASAQAIRCARGEVGTASIRGGRRTVTLSPLGAITFYFDPLETVEHAAPLARAVSGTANLEEANEVLHDLGVHTELDYERARTDE